MGRLSVRLQQATGDRNAALFSVSYVAAANHVSDLIVHAIAKLTLFLQFPNRTDDLCNAAS
jgi:hypothetical protein